MVKPEEALPVTLDPEITVADPDWLIPETTRLDASVEARLLSTLSDIDELDVEKVPTISGNNEILIFGSGVLLSPSPIDTSKLA